MSAIILTASGVTLELPVDLAPVQLSAYVTALAGKTRRGRRQAQPRRAGTGDQDHVRRVRAAVARERQVDLEESSRELYEMQLRVHLTPYFGRRRLNRIDAPLVADVILQQKRKKHAGATIRNAVRVLNGVMRHAVARQLIAVNPVDLVDPREREKVQSQPKRILTIDEVELLVAGAREFSLRLLAMVGLFVYSGLRAGEALGLRWRDTDYDAGVIHVRKQLDRKTRRLRDVKTEAGRRDVPISSALRKALREWYLNSEFKDNDHFVLATDSGKATDHRNCHRQVTGLALRVGINVAANREADADKPNLDVHALRHVFGSACVRATNGDVEKVARWIGPPRQGHAPRGVLPRVRGLPRRAAHRTGHRTARRGVRWLDNAAVSPEARLEHAGVRRPDDLLMTRDPPAQRVSAGSARKPWNEAGSSRGDRT